MGLKLGVIEPTLVGVRIANNVAYWIGEKRKWAYALESTCQTVVGRPTFGLTSLARHGKVELEGKKINRGDEGNVGRGKNKFDRCSTYSDGECKWRMQCRGQTLEIRTTTKYYLHDDERNDGLGSHECRGDVALLHHTSSGWPSLVFH